MKPNPNRTLDDVRRSAADRQRTYRAKKTAERAAEREQARIAAAKDATPPIGEQPAAAAAPSSPPNTSSTPAREQLDWVSPNTVRVHKTVRIEQTFAGLSPESFAAVPKAMPAANEDAPPPPEGAPPPEPSAFVDETPPAGPTQAEKEAAAAKVAMLVALLVKRGVGDFKELVAASELGEPWRSKLLEADPAWVVGFVYEAAQRVAMKHDFLARTISLPYEDELVVLLAAAGSVFSIVARKRQLAEQGKKGRPEAAAIGDRAPADDERDEPAPPAASSGDWGDYGVGAVS